MKVSNIKQRRDGKYSITISFPGSPNAFGGVYPGRVFHKIVTTEQLATYVKPEPAPQQTAQPATA